MKPFYKNILDGLPTPLAVVREDGNIIFANAAWKQFATDNGACPENVSENINYFQICDDASGDHSEGSKSFANGIRMVQSGLKSSFALEYPCHSPTEERWFVGTITPCPGDESGLVVVTHQNITDRKKVENKIKTQARDLKTIFDAAPNVLALINEEIRVEIINIKGTALMGKNKEELEGLLCGDVFNCENSLGGQGCGCNMNCPPCPLRSRIMSTFKTGKSHIENDCQMTFWLNDKKTTLDLLVSTALLEMDKGKRVLLSLTDITEQKKLTSRLQQAQKLESIGSLSGGIAHDFNNLLFPIIGLSELLLEDLTPSSPEYEKVQEILKAGNRGSQLVNQILSFSRQETQKKVPVRIQKVVKEVIKLARSTIPADIKITQCIDPDCGLVMADPTQLHQIAMNLVTNAYHAVEKNTGCIDIKVKAIRLDSGNLIDENQSPGKYAVLVVADNGVGISPTNLEKIFDPYFTTKEKGKGTGLGLSTVYGIVKEHQGDIKVYSEPGIGTTFKVFLPLMQKTDPVESDEKVEIMETGKETILLVDDEISIVRLERQMLERLGYKVTARTSSMDALEAFKSRPEKYDLVISDMNMPNMNGIQLAKEIQKTRPDMPIVLCTGFSERISREITKKIGIKGFLMKPVAKAEMAGVVRKILDEVKV